MNGLAAPKVSASAEKPVPVELLVNVPKLIAANYAEVPNNSVPRQCVAFGTTEHRGSAFAKSFNEAQVLAISQAICHYRRKQHIDGPHRVRSIVGEAQEIVLDAFSMAGV
jgi:phosphoglucomutase